MYSSVGPRFNSPPSPFPGVPDDTERASRAPHPFAGPPAPGRISCIISALANKVSSLARERAVAIGARAISHEGSGRVNPIPRIRSDAGGAGPRSTAVMDFARGGARHAYRLFGAIAAAFGSVSIKLIR